MLETWLIIITFVLHVINSGLMAHYLFIFVRNVAHYYYLRLYILFITFFSNAKALVSRTKNTKMLFF